LEPIFTVLLLAPRIAGLMEVLARRTSIISMDTGFQSDSISEILKFSPPRVQWRADFSQ
jgi:hypothetical protein